MLRLRALFSFFCESVLCIFLAGASPQGSVGLSPADDGLSDDSDTEGLTGDLGALGSLTAGATIMGGGGDVGVVGAGLLLGCGMVDAVAAVFMVISWRVLMGSGAGAGGGCSCGGGPVALRTRVLKIE